MKGVQQRARFMSQSNILRPLLTYLNVFETWNLLYEEGLEGSVDCREKGVRGVGLDWVRRIIEGR
jgi:hypothetical protein